ncbi:MAG: hypothetical protein WCH39_09600, partial [Schlesneria sp.]
SQSSESSSAMAVTLIEHLARAEAELARLRKVTESADELGREAAVTSPAELRNEIAQRESTILELERERKRLEQQSQKWLTRKKEKLSQQFDLEPLKEEQRKTELAASDLERQLADEQAENRTIFTLPRGLQKEGWLAVIDAHQITVAPLGLAARPTTFVATGLSLFGSSPSGNFEKWIVDQRLSSAYFLLLVRPDAAVAFDKVQEMLEKKMVSHGFDLIGADQKILHPDRGAAP